MTNPKFRNLVLLALAACSGNISVERDGHPTGATAGNSGTPTGGADASSGTGGSVPTPMSGGTTGHAPDAVAEGPAGYLGCPTVPYPGATKAVAQLSTQFQQVCGQCHGSWGEGRANYPTIPGQLDVATFIGRVRQGKGAMPAFGSDFVTDAALSADFHVLTAKASGSQSVTLQHPSFAWTAAEVDAKYQAGLAMWRTADGKGEACANCHSADAIDLALIGYEDATIMRRGLLHLSAPQVLTLVDFVHAQRRRYNITRPCSTDWRPFQPGGKVLPGNTIAEQEASMGSQLKHSGLLIATGKVETLADAHKAWDELAAVDLRKFPIGIPMARWTEDGFNGEAHKSFDEWVPKLAYVPKDRGKWIAAMDEYLASPGDESLAALDAAFYANRPSYDGRPDSQWLDTTYNKYRAVQFAGHYFRLSAAGKPGWFERPVTQPAGMRSPARFVDASPFIRIGGNFAEKFCRANGGYGGATCDSVMKEIPPEIRVELPPDGDLQAIDDEFRNISHHWFMQAQVFDQTLIDNEHAFYWNLYDFRHNVIHQAFLNAQKFVKQTTLSRASNRIPDGVDMLLNAEHLEYRGTDGQLGGPAITTDAVRLKANIVRMYLLLQRELLNKGAPVWIYTPRYVTRLAGTEGLTLWMDGFKSSAGDFGKAAASAGMAEAKLWGSDTVALADEVRALMAKAKDVAIGVDLGQP